MISQLPKNWKEFYLGELSYSVSNNGKLIKGKQIQEYSEDLYPAYSATGQDIWREKFDNEGSAIIISAVGARCGKCFKADKKWSAVANTHVLFPNKGVNRDYLFYYINNENFWEKGGVAQPFVKVKDTLRRKVVPMPINSNGNPDLKEQKRIVAILEKAEQLKKKREEANKKMEELIPALFVKMFGDPATNPMGWEKTSLNNLGSLDRGKSQYRPRTASKLFGGPYPFIQTGDIANSGWKIKSYSKTYSKIGLAQSKLWPKNTLCITIAANIADTAILDFEACFPDSVVGFIPNENSNLFYVYSLFGFLKDGLEHIAPMAAQKNINLEILRNLMVLEPPIELQNKFAKKIEELEEQKTKQNKLLDSINNLFNSLMQKAFKGKL